MKGTCPTLSTACCASECRGRKCERAPCPLPFLGLVNSLQPLSCAVVISRHWADCLTFSAFHPSHLLPLAPLAPFPFPFLLQHPATGLCYVQWCDGDSGKAASPLLPCALLPTTSPLPVLPTPCHSPRCFPYHVQWCDGDTGKAVSSAPERQGRRVEGQLLHRPPQGGFILPVFDVGFEYTFGWRARLRGVGLKCTPLPPRPYRPPWCVVLQASCCPSHATITVMSCNLQDTYPTPPSYYSYLPLFLAIPCTCLRDRCVVRQASCCSSTTLQSTSPTCMPASWMRTACSRCGQV